MSPHYNQTRAISAIVILGRLKLVEVYSVCLLEGVGDPVRYEGSNAPFTIMFRYGIKVYVGPVKKSGQKMLASATWPLNWEDVEIRM